MTAMNFVGGRTFPDNTHFNQENIGEPRLEIVEQPKSRGYRFRYECEGASHGNITGSQSTKGKKTFPAVKLINWTGAAKISVQCVTLDDPPRPHTHELLGKECKNGIGSIEIPMNAPQGHEKEIMFSGLSIKHSTRKRAEEILTLRNEERYLEQKMASNMSDVDRVDKKFVLTDEEKIQAREEAKDTCPQLNLSVVRLQFTAMLIHQGKVHRTLQAISDPIFDAKSPGAAALRICRMDKSSGSCVGGDEVFLLCDKVQKDDIAVCFQEYDSDGKLKWEEYGKFGPQDVHRQYAIVFRTPPYVYPQINNPVEVKVKLKRIQRPEESNAVAFTYHPEQQDEDRIKDKKRKKLNHVFADPRDQRITGPMHTSMNSGNVNTPTGFTGNGTQGQQRGQGHMQPVHAPGMRTHHQMRPHTKLPYQAVHQSPNRGQQGHVSNAPYVTDINMIRLQAAQSGPVIYPLSQSSCTVTGRQQSLAHSSGTASPSSFVASPYSTDFTLSPMSTMTPSPPNMVQPTEHAMNLDFNIGYSGRGSSNGGQGGHTEPVDLSKARPMDLRTKGLAVDGQPDSIPHFPDTLAESMANLDISKSDTTKVSLKNQASSEAELSKQVVQFGDRLFKGLQDFARTADVGYLLLVQRALLSQEDENGDNILHLAVVHNKLDVLRSLLRVTITLPQKDIVNLKNNLHQTPLHLACITRDAMAVELLLLHSASLTAVDHQGNTPIHLAARHTAPQCLATMLANDIQRNNGTSPSVNKLNYKGLSALHLAVMSGQMDCVKKLIKIGKADINIQDGCSGQTPLHYAVERDHLAIVGYLVTQASVNVDMSDYSGATPLHYALRRQLIGCTSVLMTAGADPYAEIIEQVGDLEDNTSESDTGDESDADSKLSSKERRKQREEKEKDQEEEKEKDEEEVQVISGKTDIMIITGWTLAQGNEKLESILRGDQCDEPVNTLDSAHLSRFLYSGGPPIDTQTNTTLYTVPPNISKDLIEMDSMARTQLAKLLDPMNTGHDWKALTVQLGAEHLIETFGLMDSPTKALLDNFEANEGDLEKLQTGLTQIQRPDAVRIIEDVLARKETARIVHGKPNFVSTVMDTDRFESGLGSMSLKS